MSKTISSQYQKRITSLLDYHVDWSDWLGTDTIATSSWSVTTGITVESSSNTTTKATIWVSGGVAQTMYEATNTITTAAGRRDSRTIVLEGIE